MEGRRKKGTKRGKEINNSFGVGCTLVCPTQLAEVLLAWHDSHMYRFVSSIPQHKTVDEMSVYLHQSFGDVHW